MTGYTPEQLQLVAKWLGGRKLVPASAVIVQPRPMDEWYFEGTNADGNGFYPIWSDADLFCAIDDKAVAEGLFPDLKTCPHRLGRSYTIYGDGPLVIARADGPTRLSAAIAAVLKMLEGRT